MLPVAVALQVLLGSGSLLLTWAASIRRKLLSHWLRHPHGIIVYSWEMNTSVIAFQNVAYNLQTQSHPFLSLQIQGHPFLPLKTWRPPFHHSLGVLKAQGLLNRNRVGIFALNNPRNGLCIFHLCFRCHFSEKTSLLMPWCPLSLLYLRNNFWKHRHSPLQSQYNYHTRAFHFCCLNTRSYIWLIILLMSLIAKRFLMWMWFSWVFATPYIILH